MRAGTDDAAQNKQDNCRSFVRLRVKCLLLLVLLSFLLNVADFLGNLLQRIFVRSILQLEVYIKRVRKILLTACYTVANLVASWLELFATPWSSLCSQNVTSWS